MKKLLVFLIAISVFAAGGCRLNKKIVEFSDDAFRKNINQALQKDEFAEITENDLEKIKELRIIGKYCSINSQNYEDAYTNVFNGDPMYGNINKGKIISLSDIKNFINLEVLEVSYNDIEDGYIEFANPEKIKIIKLTRSLVNIKNLDFIKELNNVETLILDQNHIEDINALGGKNSIKYLDLEGNYISDITALSSLDNIEYLNLTSNLIQDITVLKGLRNIKTLELALTRDGWPVTPKNNIDNLESIKYLINLENLNLRYQGSEKDIDFSFISHLSKLKILDLYACMTSDITFLENLHDIEYLNLQNNKLTNVDSLAGLVNLKELNLANNKPLNNINGIKNLRNIEILNIQHLPNLINKTFLSYMGIKEIKE